MTDVNILNAMNVFFSNERVELILDAMKRKKAAKVFIDTIGQSSNLDIQSKFIKMFSICILYSVMN